MNYEKIYNQLINKRKKIEPLTKEIGNCERHHILPKCLGGKNTKDNLVNLTIREHYLAHKLLCNITKNKYGEESKEYRKMMYALWYMTHTRKENIQVISSKEFEEFKKKFAYLNSLNNSGEKHWHYNQHWSNEVKEKISKAHKGKKLDPKYKCRMQHFGKDNPNYGHKWTDEQRKRASELRKGKPLSELAKQKLIEYYKTHDNPMKGVNVKDRMTTEAYEKMLQHRSESMKEHYKHTKAKNPFEGKTKEELMEIKEKQKLGHKKRLESMTVEELEKEKEKKRKAARLSQISKKKQKEKLLLLGIQLPKKSWYNNGKEEVLSETQPNGFIKGRLKRNND